MYEWVYILCTLVSIITCGCFIILFPKDWEKKSEKVRKGGREQRRERRERKREKERGREWRREGERERKRGREREREKEREGERESERERWKSLSCSSGPLGAGKTSLMLRYIYDTFEDKISRFVSEEKKSITVDGREVVLDIWDTAGKMLTVSHPS